MKPGSVIVASLDPGEWSASFGLSLVDLVLFDACGPQRIVPNGMHLREFCSTGGLVAGRNKLAAAFLDKTEGEWLFMVDSDMGFAADTVEKLIRHADKYTRPVIGGLCFGLRRTHRKDNHALRFKVVPTIYQFVELDDEVGFAPVFEYKRDAVVECSGTGAACLLVHRRALEKVREKYGDHWFDPVTHPKGKDGPTVFSEDLSFCVRLAAVDVPLFVHTGVKTSHYKGGVYLDEEVFDAQQAKE